MHNVKSVILLHGVLLVLQVSKLEFHLQLPVQLFVDLIFKHGSLINAHTVAKSVRLQTFE